MKYAFEIFLIFLCICTSSLSVTAQQEDAPLLTAQFKLVLFKQFVREVESKTGFHFYYHPRQVDSIYVTGSFTDQPLETVLEQLLHQQGLEFALDKSNKIIYVTLGYKINPDLPKGFFKEEPIEEEATESFVADYFEEKENKSWIRQDKTWEIGKKTNTIKAGNAQIIGQVRNVQTGEQVIGATVFIEEPLIGAVTDAFGNFSLTIPKGRHTLKVRSVGMMNQAFKILLYSAGRLDLELTENVVHLKAVEVNADRNVQVQQTCTCWIP